MLSVAVSLVGGLIFGYLFLDTDVKDTLDLILMSALDVMIFIAGIEIGSNRGILKRICNLHSALLALAIPLAVACGSICGALLLGHIAGLSAYDSLLVGGGLGWYSFSSVVISAMYSTRRAWVVQFFFGCYKCHVQYGNWYSSVFGKYDARNFRFLFNTAFGARA